MSNEDSPHMMTAEEIAVVNEIVRRYDERQKRCRSRRGSVRCELEAGHGGPHSSEFGDW